MSDPKTTEPTLVLQARTPSIGEWVEACARGELGFDVLCQRVAAKGFKTTSLFEMVRAAETPLS
jgi:hypothetical protein